MKKLNKIQKMALGALALGIIVSGASIAEASKYSPVDGTNPMQNLVTKISERFNLDSTEVQKVFDEQRVEMQEKHQEQLEIRINQAVVDGKLTQVQADLIIAKHAELKASRPDLSGKTKEEIKAFMKEKRSELKAWMSDNNIPAEFMLGFGEGHREAKGPKGQKDHRAMR